VARAKSSGSPTLKKTKQAPSHELEHRDGDVYPPLVACDLVEQLVLSPNYRDAAVMVSSW
jgi:hypothetical protein